MIKPARILVRTILHVVGDLASLMSSTMRSRAQLAAENLFLRKQLAMYQERRVKPRRADDDMRITLVALSRFLEWRRLLTVVKPETLIRWHRIPTVLAPEIVPARAPADSSRPAAAHCHNGGGESDMGRGTDCRRAPRETRHSRVAADGQTVPAVATTWSSAAVRPSNGTLRSSAWPESVCSQTGVRGQPTALAASIEGAFVRVRPVA